MFGGLVDPERRQQRVAALTRQPPGTDVATRANAALLAGDIRRFLNRPAGSAPPVVQPDVPPGAPIGEPAIDWLGRLPDEPLRSGYWQ